MDGEVTFIGMDLGTFKTSVACSNGRDWRDPCCCCSAGRRAARSRASSPRLEWEAPDVRAPTHLARAGLPGMAFLLPPLMWLRRLRRRRIH